MIRPIRIANDVYLGVRIVVRPIRSHRDLQVSRQSSRLIYALAACSVASQTFKGKRFSQIVFLVIKVRNISEIGVE